MHFYYTRLFSSLARMFPSFAAKHYRIIFLFSLIIFSNFLLCAYLMPYLRILTLINHRKLLIVNFLFVLFVLTAHFIFLTNLLNLQIIRTFIFNFDVGFLILLLILWLSLNKNSFFMLFQIIIILVYF